MEIVDLGNSFLPALVVGGVAIYFFKMFFKNEITRRNLMLIREGKKQTLPLRIQAFERIILFLERINPSSLLVRIKPIGEDKVAYASLLMSTIEQEYEHNLSQQIYISEESWNIITSSKNATIQIIKEVSIEDAILNAQMLREGVLKKIIKTTAPSSVAISIVKKEVLKLM
jgi:hypothetical protein